jgi:hypothetical protein
VSGNVARVRELLGNLFGDGQAIMWIVAGHSGAPRSAGGSAIGLSATDAYGQSLGR